MFTKSHKGNRTHDDTFPFRQVCQRIAAFTALKKEVPMKKMAIASVAVLILGSSAALAQPYGYANRYDYQTRNCDNPDRAYDHEMWRTGHMEKVMNCIADPAASGHAISQAEYLARYPWSDTRTWVYDPVTDRWTDHTRDYGAQYSRNYDRQYSRDNQYSRDYRYRRYRE